MNKKVVIGLTVAAAATAYLMRDKIFGNATNVLSQNNSGGNDIMVTIDAPNVGAKQVPLSALEDKVVLAIGNPGKYRIMKGQRVTYQEEQAYINDGSRELVWMPLAEMEKIPGAAYYISVTGIKYF